MRDYVRQSAIAHGIDPDVAERVARHEGLQPGTWQSNSYKNGIREPSYGPFQLLDGGPGTGFKRGLGNSFRKMTGLDPSDPKNWRATVDFALEHAADNGWGAWYGAKAAGVKPMQGIGVAANTAPPVAAEARLTAPAGLMAFSPEEPTGPAAGGLFANLLGGMEAQAAEQPAAGTPLSPMPQGFVGSVAGRPFSPSASSVRGLMARPSIGGLMQPAGLDQRMSDLGVPPASMSSLDRRMSDTGVPRAALAAPSQLNPQFSTATGEVPSIGIGDIGHMLAGMNHPNVSLPPDRPMPDQTLTRGSIGPSMAPQAPATPRPTPAAPQSAPAGPSMIGGIFGAPGVSTNDLGLAPGPAPAAPQSGPMGPDGVADPFGNYKQGGPSVVANKLQDSLSAAAAAAPTTAAAPQAPKPDMATPVAAAVLNPSVSHLYDPIQLGSIAKLPDVGTTWQPATPALGQPQNINRLASLQPEEQIDPAAPELGTATTLDDYPAAPEPSKKRESLFSPQTKAGMAIGSAIGGLPGMIVGGLMASGKLGGLFGNPALGPAGAGEQFGVGSIAQAMGGARGATARSRSDPRQSITSRGPSLGWDLTNQFGAVTPYDASGNIVGANRDTMARWGGLLSGLFGGQGNVGGYGGISKAEHDKFSGKPGLW